MLIITIRKSKIRNETAHQLHFPLVCVLLRLKRQTGQESCCKKTECDEFCFQKAFSPKHMMSSVSHLNPFAPGDFAKKSVLKLVKWFSGHCHATKS